MSGLAELRKLEYHVTMLTNRQLASTLAILRNLGVRQMFEHVEAPSGPDEPTVKPVPKMLNRYGVPDERRNEVLFIGDSNLDIASANQYGLHTVAVLTGMGSERVLVFARPAAIVKDIVAAASLLGRD